MTWVRLTWQTRLRHHTQQPADNKSLQDVRLIFHFGCVQKHSRYCWNIHKIYQWILTNPRRRKDLRNNNQDISPGWPMGWQHHPALSLWIEVVCPQRGSPDSLPDWTLCPTFYHISNKYLSVSVNHNCYKITMQCHRHTTNIQRICYQSECHSQSFSIAQ